MHDQEVEREVEDVDKTVGTPISIECEGVSMQSWARFLAKVILAISRISPCDGVFIRYLEGNRRWESSL